MVPFGRRAIVILLVCVACLQVLMILVSNHAAVTGKRDVRWQTITGVENLTRYQRIHRNDSEEETSNNKSCSELQSPFKDALLFPTPHREKGFLTIGIPTIKRTNNSYIMDTITSLLDNMSPLEKEEVRIVVLLADRDPKIRRSLAEEIKSHHGECIKSGMLHIIQAPAYYYPDFESITKLTYKETKQHVMWRAKQCYDYAYLQEYCQTLSAFYMQLEDDVVTSPGYIAAIKKFMSEQQGKSWICLEFSELGFIGKLYKSSHLRQLAAILKLFYIEQPPDYTYTYFNMLMLQMSQRLRKPTLFQHRGVESSLPGKVQLLKDRFYADVSVKGKGDNPPAAVYSSMKTYMTYYPHLAYTSGHDGYFWSHGHPKKGSTFTVVFSEPQRLRHVVIETGTNHRPNDIIRQGVLLVGFGLNKAEDHPTCHDTVVVREFKNGRVDVTDLDKTFGKKIECFVIEITGTQRDWVIVRHITVTVSNTTVPYTAASK